MRLSSLMEYIFLVAKYFVVIYAVLMVVVLAGLAIASALGVRA